MQNQQENNGNNYIVNNLEAEESQEGEEEASEEEEEEEVQEGRNEEDGSSQMPYVAPPELRLSRQEELWIWDIVCWMECHGDEEGLKKPTDYEFVLYALAAKGNTEEAIERIRGIQLFQEAYNVQDTVEEGMKAIQDFIRLYPGFLLCLASIDQCLGREGEDAGILVAVDYSKYHPARSKMTSENWRIHVLFSYYCALLGAPNFDVMRGGFRFLIDGSSITRDNINLDVAQRTFEEIYNHSPLNYKEMRLYNANFLINSFFGIIKVFMTSQMKGALKLGCQIEMAERGGQIDNFMFRGVPRLTLPDIYLRPNYDVAMQRLLDKAQDLLEEHFYNVHTFEF